MEEGKGEESTRKRKGSEDECKCSWRCMVVAWQREVEILRVNEWCISRREDSVSCQREQEGW